MSKDHHWGFSTALGTGNVGTSGVQLWGKTGSKSGVTQVYGTVTFKVQNVDGAGGGVIYVGPGTPSQVASDAASHFIGAALATTQTYTNNYYNGPVSIIADTSTTSYRYELTYHDKAAN